MARQSTLPKHLQPMLATLIDAPFDDADWVFESKWDGFRIVAQIKKGRVTLYSPNGLVVSDNYVPVAKALEKARHDAVIDGELVALDAILKDLHAKMRPLRTTSSPFQHRVKDEATTTWVKPKLVAEVRFTEWTSGGEMGHPAFLGLREDKKPEDVVMEKEARRPRAKTK